MLLNCLKIFGIYIRRKSKRILKNTDLKQLV